jgi:hypothetical protein
MAEAERITYRCVSMIAGWPERIRAAQLVTNCVIGGKEVPRVRYGEEKDDWGAAHSPCHDCGVIKDEFHVQGCDVERCAGCGGQRFNCDCEPCEDDDEE